MRQFQPFEMQAETLVGTGLELGVARVGHRRKARVDESVGLELWWFLFSKSKSRKADANQGIQEATVTVDGGYEPSRVVVNAGQLVRLNFDRRDPSSCLEAVRIPDFRIAKDLPLNQVTSIEFTPTEAGEYEFTCGMNMFRGVIEVQGKASTSESSKQSLVSQQS